MVVGCFSGAGRVEIMGALMQYSATVLVVIIVVL